MADKVIMFIARILEGMFLFGAALVLIVIVLTLIDIVRAISVPDSPAAKSEIDAMNRAA